MNYKDLDTPALIINRNIMIDNLKFIQKTGDIALYPLLLKSPPELLRQPVTERILFAGRHYYIDNIHIV